MYDERYYSDREKDLENDFNESKEKAFAKLVGTVEEWKAEAGKIQSKFKELTDRKTKAQAEDKAAAEATAKPVAEIKEVEIKVTPSPKAKTEEAK